MVATVARWINSGETGVAAAVVDISGVAVGESMLVLMCIGSTSITVTPPAGWTAAFPKTSMGSRACLGFVRTKAGAGETSATFTASGATGQATALLGIVGALPATWAIGSVWTRALNGTSLTNVIDGWNADVPGSLALAISFEATTAAESPNTIAGVNNGFAELGYKPQNTIIETIWAGTKAIAATGDVGDVTVTYRNTQASNGAGLMIGFHPAPASVTASAVVATGNGTMPAPAVRVSNTVVPPTSSGSGTAVAPVLKVGATITPPAMIGIGMIPAPSLDVPLEIAVPAASGTGTLPAPAVHIDVSSTPPASIGTGTSPAPSVDISVEVIAEVSSGTGAMPAPAVKIDAKSTPPAAIGTGEGIAPVVSVGVIVSAPAATGSGIAVAPTVTSVSGVVVSPLSAHGTGQAHAPILHAGVTVSAPAALGSGMMPAPDMGAGEVLPVKGILVAITPSRELHAVTPSRDLVAITSRRGLEAV